MYIRGVLNYQYKHGLNGVCDNIMGPFENDECYHYHKIPVSDRPNIPVVPIR